MSSEDTTQASQDLAQTFDQLNLNPTIEPPNSTPASGSSFSALITNPSTHQSSTNNVASTATPATTFHQFTSFALKLREQIWFAAFDNLPGRVMMLSPGRTVQIEKDGDQTHDSYNYRFGLGHAIYPEPEILNTCPEVAKVYMLYQGMTLTTLGDNFQDNYGPRTSPSPDDLQFDPVMVNLNKDIILFDSYCTKEAIARLAQFLSPTTCPKIRHIGKLGGWPQRGRTFDVAFPAPPPPSLDLSFIYKCFPKLMSISLVREGYFAYFGGYFGDERRRLAQVAYTLATSFAKHWKNGTTNAGAAYLAHGCKKYLNAPEENGKPDTPCPSVKFSRLVRSWANRW